MSRNPRILPKIRVKWNIFALQLSEINIAIRTPSPTKTYD